MGGLVARQAESVGLPSFAFARRPECDFPTGLPDASDFPYPTWPWLLCGSLLRTYAPVHTWSPIDQCSGSGSYRPHLESGPKAVQLPAGGCGRRLGSRRVQRSRGLAPMCFHLPENTSQGVSLPAKIGIRCQVAVSKRRRCGAKLLGRPSLVAFTHAESLTAGHMDENLQSCCLRFLVPSEALASVSNLHNSPGRSRFDALRNRRTTTSSIDKASNAL
jgi:hypothetical protein